MSWPLGQVTRRLLQGKLSLPARCISAWQRSASSSTQVENCSAKAEMRPWTTQSKRIGAVGFKIGMLSHYDEWGRRYPVTVIHLDQCQVMRSFPLGKQMVQEVGSGRKSARQLHQAQFKMYRELQIAPKLAVRGFSVTKDGLLPPGTPLLAAHFVPGQYVDLQSVSLGKGFQGAMKRWGFKGLPASHGVSLSHRALGATGCRTSPGKVHKGKKMAGRMGGHNVTVKSALIVKIDNALNCIFVRSPVAGYDGTPVRIVDSKRNPIFQKNPPPFPTYIHGSDKAPLPRFQVSPSSPQDTLHIKAQE